MNEKINSNLSKVNLPSLADSLEGEAATQTPGGVSKKGVYMIHSEEISCDTVAKFIVDVLSEFDEDIVVDDFAIIDNNDITKEEDYYEQGYAIIKCLDNFETHVVVIKNDADVISWLENQLKNIRLKRWEE